MNKKNFPIFISLFIVSLFFTLVFYFAYTNWRANYEYFMAKSFYHVNLGSEIEEEEIEKIKDVDGVEYIGKLSLDPKLASYKDKLIVINYQDQEVNKMREYSMLLEGNFPQKEDEIVVSQTFAEKNDLGLDDKIDLDLGRRTIDGQEISPTSTYTDKEEFEKESSQEYTVVGIHEDVYNKNSGISYGLSNTEDMQSFLTVLKFDSFEEAYEDRQRIEGDIEDILSRDIDLNIDEGLVSYYGLEKTGFQKVMSKSVNIFALVGCILLFVFFIKNIFWVWGIRKIRRLSVYKSIGSTDFQIYSLLLKEAIVSSLIPILLGHGLGFATIYYIYKQIERGQDISFFETVEFNPKLSLIIILVALFVIAIAIISPAKKLAKINIIDGIKGNIDFLSSKKKRAKDLWKELKINNLASIKSQRYISSIGVIIISVFLIFVSVGRYYRVYSTYDDGYNINVDYYSKSDQVPKLLDEIVEELPNSGAYVSRSKYIKVKMNQDYSDQAKKARIDEEIADLDMDNLEARLIALKEEDLNKLGGKKGDFILYNAVQEDPYEPLSGAKMIPYFKNPERIDILIGENFEKSLDIARSTQNLSSFTSKTDPFMVKIYTDFETFSSLMKEAGNESYLRYPFELRISVGAENEKASKDFIEDKIRDNISPDESYNILAGEEIKDAQASDIENLMTIIVALGLIIFILNITNGYSSINISLMSRKKEIGSLLSCGMDQEDLKDLYEKEFLIEQVKSFVLVIFVSLIIMAIVSYLSPTINFKIMLSYFDYSYFLIFALVVYLVNFIIYHFSLKRILSRSVIELIGNY